MTTEIQEYSQTEAALVALRDEYAGKVYEVDTTSGMADAKEARATVRSYRTALETMRKDIKAPALERCRLIDTEAKRITTELRELEDPIDAQIKGHEAKKEAERQAKIDAELKRVETIQETIEVIRSMSAKTSVTSTSEQIAKQLAEAQEIEITPFFAEFTDSAQAAKDTAVLALKGLHAERVAYEAEQEKIKVERAELARLREEQEKREAEDRAKREAIEAEAQAKREADEKKQREALEAERKKQEKAQAKIDAENKRLADERAALKAEQQRIADEKESERKTEEKRKAEAAALAKKSKYPGEQAIVSALAEYFSVTDEIARSWLAELRKAA